MVIHLNIGSNRGDRQANLALAVTRLSQAIPGNVLISSVIESEPWGYDSPEPYLNQAVAIEIADGLYSPLEILRITRQVQNSIDPTPHRDSSGAYIDRTIDIDIIAIDNIILDVTPQTPGPKEPLLILPHPRMHLRPFVLIPLAELAPTWLHPIFHLTPTQMLDTLDSSIKDAQ